MRIPRIAATIVVRAFQDRRLPPLRYVPANRLQSGDTEIKPQLYDINIKHERPFAQGPWVSVLGSSV